MTTDTVTIHIASNFSINADWLTAEKGIRHHFRFILFQWPLSRLDLVHPSPAPGGFPSRFPTPSRIRISRPQRDLTEQQPREQEVEQQRKQGHHGPQALALEQRMRARRFQG